MKIKLLHHATEWLEGDFESPKNLRAPQKDFSVWKVAISPLDGSIAMKTFQNGTCIWNKEHRLIFQIEDGIDIAWHNETGHILSLESSHTPSKIEGKNEAYIRLRDKDHFIVLSEYKIFFPTGGATHLIPSPDGSTYAVTWLDQTEWGYILINSANGTPIGKSTFFQNPTFSPPAFSPDGTLLVSCHFLHSGWWTDEIDDYWESPSGGGKRMIGIITVHNIASDTVSYHDVTIDLPAGWLPLNAEEESGWDMLWGPEFISGNEFRIWLPDNSIEILHLPLPPHIEITHSLNTARI
jgi:hypothetical protein